jgi:hypothetical protein
MATQTSNFGFTKPDVNEFYDVNVQNENWDKLDEQLGGTLPISKGGTGASNSSQARANLGIAEEYWTFTLEDGTTVTKLVCAT